MMPPMPPRIQQRLLILAASLLALVIGQGIAEESLLLPITLCLVAAGFVTVYLTRVPLDVATLGLLLIGYFVGNRGFAQLMPLPGLPLFPAELGLALGLVWCVYRSARHQEPLWRHDLLNHLLLLWIAFGTVRLAIDLRQYKLLALRDYATVYYAVFFFLAQQVARQERYRTFLLRCALFGALALWPVSLLANHFPDFFLHTLTFRGNPLIFFKNDLVQTFLGAGSMLLFHASGRPLFERFCRYLAILLGLVVLTENSRAAIAGLLTAMLWLFLGRRSTYGRSVSLVGFLVACGLLLAVWLGWQEWQRSPLHLVGERTLSIFDPAGNRAYENDALADKADNNRFRKVWWESVIAETLQDGLWFGLGFGHDLAGQFLRKYDYDLGEDFSVRSPHNIMLTIFGRMGAIGLAIWIAIIAVLMRHTWHCLHRADPAAHRDVGLWCACWVILISSCFGVVLEGPMGATIFWLLLGLASSAPPATDPPREPTAETAEIAPAALSLPPAT